MKRLLVNDMLSALPEHRTFWNDLKDWFGMEFVGGDYATLAEKADMAAASIGVDAPAADLIIRNASYFGAMSTSVPIRTISILQDIFTEEVRYANDTVGPLRKMQREVFATSTRVVANSAYTLSRYPELTDSPFGAQTNRKVVVIPLPVDFDLFEPGNAMGLQQFLSLPDGCICWVGAWQSAGYVKGWDIFLEVARMNPDLNFVAVFKDSIPDSFPPNMRCYERLSQEDLSRVMGACRVGLCTSRTESQHLAGIEMGACGLPMVAPPVGVYWKRDDMPGIVVPEGAGADVYAQALRAILSQPGDPAKIRAYWQKEFRRTVVCCAWDNLIREVEA